MLEGSFVRGYISVLGTDVLIEAVNLGGEPNPLNPDDNAVEVSFLIKVNMVADEDIGGDEGGIEDFDGRMRFIPCLAVEGGNVAGVEKDFNIRITCST